MASELLSLRTCLTQFGIHLLFTSSSTSTSVCDAQQSYLHYEGEVQWWIDDAREDLRITQACSLLHLIHQHCYEQRNAIGSIQPAIAVLHIDQIVVNDKNKVDPLLCKLSLYVPM